MTRLSSFLRFLTFYVLWGSFTAFRLVVAQQIQNAVLNIGVDAFIDQLLTDWDSPGGVGVAVVRRDANTGAWNVETKGYGIARANGNKVTENTLFAIGSNTKVGDAWLMFPTLFMK
jgi:CubicO group peptidase (beta-lactamase class C family)